MPGASRMPRAAAGSAVLNVSAGALSPPPGTERKSRCREEAPASLSLRTIPTAPAACAAAAIRSGSEVISIRCRGCSFRAGDSLETAAAEGRRGSRDGHSNLLNNAAAALPSRRSIRRSSSEQEETSTSVFIVTKKRLIPRWSAASRTAAACFGGSSSTCCRMPSTEPYRPTNFLAPTSPMPLTPGTLSEVSPQMARMSMTWRGSLMPNLAQISSFPTVSSSAPPLPGLT